METILSTQRAFFLSGATRDLGFRRDQLRRLSDLIARNEAAVLKALEADMRKPPFEAYVGEVAFVREEIKFALRHLKRWAKPRRVATPWVLAVSSSRVLPEPRGVALIIGPWNYPFQLVLAPLVGAIAAGNCAVLKPSELAPHTSAVLKRIFDEGMDPRFVACVEGGVEVSRRLLELPFDHIFFTGSTRIGKVVMAAAAKHLTPVTLELGGKNPCVVDADTDLDVTARRIAWGKFFNAGQTCVAPDYLMVHASVRDALLERLRRVVRDFFGPDPRLSPDYARIINESHFDRLTGLLGEGTAVVGGESRREERYVAPTVLADVRPEHRVMEDEIFGPILPVLTYERLDEVVGFVNARPRPLALYVFSHDRKHREELLRRTSFGGGCINDTLTHLGNPRLPFGGTGASGIGAYHGQYSFDAFSHHKGVLTRSVRIDPKLLYPPYGGRLKWLRKFL